LTASLSNATKILLLSAMLHALAGCAAPYKSHTDLPTPSNQEFIEVDTLVNVPLPIAYQNILNNAPACWCMPFSGEIIAYSNAAAEGTSQISFVVPGKLLGSRVELATVRLVAQDDSHTRLVGVSSVYPGTWRLAELPDWANTGSGVCAASNVAAL
jgi:hypothetical protein